MEYRPHNLTIHGYTVDSYIINYKADCIEVFVIDRDGHKGYFEILDISENDWELLIHVNTMDGKAKELIVETMSAKYFTIDWELEDNYQRIDDRPKRQRDFEDDF